MNDEAKNDLFCLAIGFCVGCVLWINICMSYYRGKAIENGAAYYHQTTGRFKWKTAEQ